MSIRRLLAVAHGDFLACARDLSASAIRLRASMWELKPESIACIAERTGMSRETIRYAVKELIAAGWVIVAKSKGSRSHVAWPVFPGTVQAAIAAEICDEMARAANIGEWLMRAFCDVLVGSGNYVDFSRPPWLRNLLTKARLEFDREYVELKVGLECQGKQHYRSSGSAEDDKALVDQQLRDSQKIAHCTRHGVTLIEITAANLTRDVMVTKLKPVLPMTAYATAQGSPLIDALDVSGQEYMSSVIR